MKTFFAAVGLISMILSGCKTPGPGTMQQAPAPVPVRDEYYATFVAKPTLEQEKKTVLED